MASELRYKVVIYMNIPRNSHMDPAFAEGFIYGSCMGAAMMKAVDMARAWMQISPTARLVDIEIDAEPL